MLGITGLFFMQYGIEMDLTHTHYNSEGIGKLAEFTHNFSNSK